MNDAPHKTPSMKKVVIVGGGTAGWMAAAGLGRLLGKNLDIQLIESDEIGTIGVGEATIPLLTSFHQLIGVNEADFMRACQATFKLGIEFENWGAVGEKYLHAFGHLGQDCWAGNFHHFWVKARLAGDDTDLGEYSLHQHVARAGKYALHAKEDLFYAYHFDATLYARFLRAFSEKQGVKRIEGRIVHVATDADSGDIRSVRLASGQEIAGDFFIDCSGFAALLAEKTLHTGYEDWTHWLPCDRAIAVQTTAVETPAPYTHAIAREAGWQWRIPLQFRVGNGLVYCSAHQSDDEARAALVENIEGEMITEPRLIRFRTGRRLKQWNRNCVSLGLASGFLEPLESTSLYLVQSGLIRLMQLFPASEIVQAEVDEYNAQSKLEFEYIRDFIILHYHVTQRRDTPFWNYCRTMEPPASLRRRLDLFAGGGRFFRENFELFFDGSWARVMTGQGLVPKSYHPIVDMMTDAELSSFLSGIRARHALVAASFPMHHEVLERYCKADERAFARER